MRHSNHSLKCFPHCAEWHAPHHQTPCLVANMQTHNLSSHLATTRSLLIWALLWPPNHQLPFSLARHHRGAQGEISANQMHMAFCVLISKYVSVARQYLLCIATLGFKFFECKSFHQAIAACWCNWCDLNALGSISMLLSFHILQHSWGEYACPSLHTCNLTETTTNSCYPSESAMEQSSRSWKSLLLVWPSSWPYRDIWMYCSFKDRRGLEVSTFVLSQALRLALLHMFAISLAPPFVNPCMPST